jgi:streptomycin 6-kinase
LPQWIAVYAALSACWLIEDGQDASISPSTAKLALAREAG